MLIRNAEIGGKLVSLRMRGKQIAEIAEGLMPGPGEQSIDASGGALLPGLHDHHIHLNASAAALNSVRCGPPMVNGPAELAEALRAATGSGWLRGIGYHPSVAGEIDRHWLDRHGPPRPIRIQHRGGRQWIFNGQAIDLLDIDIPADGCLVDQDARLRQALGNSRPDLADLIKQLHACGITGVTEVTPGNDREDFAHYAAYAGDLELSIMGGESLHDLTGKGQALLGPLKIHNHDHDLPSLESLTRRIDTAHSHGRAVAIHCVTRAELVLSLAAIEDAHAFPGGRIEHAAIADESIIDWIARLGLAVVTQPHFIAARQDAYVTDVEPEERPHLWRLRSFLDAAIGLAAGSDSPLEGFSPWLAMASAVKRPKRLGPDEAISPEDALALYTKPAGDAGAAPRHIAAGTLADLCLLDRSWKRARSDLAEVKVVATWRAGRLVHHGGSK